MSKNWFSNFIPYDTPLVFDGIAYATPEHFYQAMKTTDPVQGLAIAQAPTAAEAKRLGRSAPLREGWEAICRDVMRFAQEHRYRPGTAMRETLRSTEGEIVEWTTWHDLRWGRCACEKHKGDGENWLGQILMELRDRVIQEDGPPVRVVVKPQPPLPVLTPPPVNVSTPTATQVAAREYYQPLPQKQPRKYVCYDTETYLVLPGLAAPRMVCGQFCAVDAATGEPSADVFVREEALFLLHHFLDEGYTIVGQNIAYDFAVSCAADPTLIPKVMRAYDEDRVEDTMIREKMIMLAQGLLADEGETGAKMQIKYSLAGIVLRRFGIDLSEDKVKVEVRADGTIIPPARFTGELPWRLRYRELDGIPVVDWPEKPRQYATDDVRWTFAVFLHQEEECAPEGIPDIYPQTRAACWLHFMGVWGVRTDPQRVHELHEQVSAEYEHMNDVLRSAGLLRSKVVKGVEEWSKDTKKLKELVVLAYGGIENTPKTGGGKKGIPGIATDRDTLLSAPAQHLDGCTEIQFSKGADGKMKKTGGCVEGCINGILRAVGERSGFEKVLSTFIPALLAGTQCPINAAWNALVATGRTSCARPNLQQPPRKGGVRECFVPRRGHCFVAADYSFVELCTLAQTCLDLFGFSKLADAINAGLDPHLDMAATLMGITYAEAVARKGETIVKEMRQMSKAANFGLPGGLGAENFMEYARATYGVILTLSRAKELKVIWQGKWPEVIKYHQYIGQRARNGGTFTMKQLRSGRIRGEVGFTDGANGFFQSMAADGAKEAGWNIHKETMLYDPYYDGKGPTPLYGSHLVLFLHDEFIIESPLDKAPYAGLRLSEVMIAGMKKYVPDVAIKAECVLMPRWLKGLDPKYDANGLPVLQVK